MGINALTSIIGTVTDLISQVTKIGNLFNQVSAFVTKPRLPEMMDDVLGDFSSLFSLGTSLLSGLNSVMSVISSIGGPSIGSDVIGGLISKATGKLPGLVTSQLIVGQRMPISMLANNPMMQPPSYIGKALFGESLAPMTAMDQPFVKRVGAFSTTDNASGNMSFGMQNFGSFGGGLSLAGMVSKVALGLNSVPTIGPVASYVNQLTSNVGNILGAGSLSIVEPRRSDNSIPFMIAMGSALVNDTKTLS